MSPAKKPTAKSSASKTKSGAAKSKPNASRKSSASKTKSGAAKKSSKESAKSKSSAKKTAAQSKASKPKSTAANTKASRSRSSKSDKSSGAGPKKTPASSSRSKTSARSGATQKAPGRTGSGKTTQSSARSTRPRPVKFDAKALAAIRERLTKEREDLKQQIVEIDEESFEGTQSDLTGEAAIDEDFADAGTATFDRERALSLQNNSRDLIGQIDRALERIEDGSYGSCDRCGRPIDAARIKALPHASLCMDCKRREERAR